MTKQQRYDSWITDVSTVTLSEAEAAGHDNYIAWVEVYWYWVQNNSMPPGTGGDRPTHKPPTP